MREQTSLPGFAKAQMNVKKHDFNPTHCADEDQPLAVGQQDKLEYDAWIAGTGSRFIVLEVGIQMREVEFVIDQTIQCEGKAAGDDLCRQDNR